ncbi:hypothetical protein J6S35_02925 [Candidatus Saccharibacteria bacterium]|nr:hypothetical protein [Candidatus Saccharibacteria bacterium]
MIRKITTRFLFALATVLSITGISFIMGNAPVSATDNPISLQISPTKQRVTLNPGDSYTGSFEVMNIGKESFSYSVDVSPYWVVDEKYAAKYDVRNNYTQIADWITFDESTQGNTIDPGETQEVFFTVDVPYDVPAGGQYATIFAQTDDGNESDANLQVVNRVGMVFYAKVDGDTREEGKIISNSVPGFTLSSPITAASLVENTGNVEATAYYKFKVMPLFSDVPVFDNEDGRKKADVLPGTKRANNFTWDSAPIIGIYRIEQTIDFLDEHSSVSKVVIICPFWLLVVLACLVIFVIYLIVKNKSRKSQSA